MFGQNSVQGIRCPPPPTMEKFASIFNELIICIYACIAFFTDGFPTIKMI